MRIISKGISVVERTTTKLDGLTQEGFVISQVPRRWRATLSQGSPEPPHTVTFSCSAGTARFQETAGPLSLRKVLHPPGGQRGLSLWRWHPSHRASPNSQVLTYEFSYMRLPVWFSLHPVHQHEVPGNPRVTVGKDSIRVRTQGVGYTGSP